MGTADYLMLGQLFWTFKCIFEAFLKGKSKKENYLAILFFFALPKSWVISVFHFLPTLYDLSTLNTM